MHQSERQGEARRGNAGSVCSCCVAPFVVRGRCGCGGERRREGRNLLTSAQVHHMSVALPPPQCDSLSPRCLLAVSSICGCGCCAQLRAVSSASSPDRWRRRPSLGRSPCLSPRLSPVSDRVGRKHQTVCPSSSSAPRRCLSQPVQPAGSHAGVLQCDGRGSGDGRANGIETQRGRAHTRTQESGLGETRAADGGRPCSHGHAPHDASAVRAHGGAGRQPRGTGMRPAG